MIEDGRLILRFQVTERKKQGLQRDPERLSKVVQVEAYSYDDSRLRPIALVQATTLADLNLAATSIQSERLLRPRMDRPFC